MKSILSFAALSAAALLLWGATAPAAEVALGDHAYQTAGEAYDRTMTAANDAPLEARQNDYRAPHDIQARPSRWPGDHPDFVTVDAALEAERWTPGGILLGRKAAGDRVPEAGDFRLEGHRAIHRMTAANDALLLEDWQDAYGAPHGIQTVEASTIPNAGWAQPAPPAIGPAAGTLVAAVEPALHARADLRDQDDLLKCRTAAPTSHGRNRWGSSPATGGVTRASPAVASQFA